MKNTPFLKPAPDKDKMLPAHRMETKNKPSMKTKPKFYVSTVTGEKYDYAGSGNFGISPGNTVKIKNCEYLDLPAEGYPYTLEYEDLPFK